MLHDVPLTPPPPPFCAPLPSTQALKLNPEASHIWGYLRVTFTSMDRFDLVTLASSQDPNAFDGEFGAALAEI